MKKTSILLAAGLWLAVSAHAASFDCAKAKTKVEKLICNDSELSKLDEDLLVAYTTALKADANTASVGQAQRKWIKERNGCNDVACVKNAYQNRATAIAIAIATQSAQGIEELYGKWKAGGRAGIAIYGTMEISKSKITWKGYSRANPRCTVSYELASEGDVIEFKVDPDHFQHISPFKSHVLAIHGECALKITHFRLTLPSNLPGYLDMIEYCKGLDEACGYGHFYKQ